MIHAEHVKAYDGDLFKRKLDAALVEIQKGEINIILDIKHSVSIGFASDEGFEVVFSALIIYDDCSEMDDRKPQGERVVPKGSFVPG